MTHHPLKQLFRAAIPVFMAANMAGCTINPSPENDGLGQGVIGIGFPATSSGAAFTAWTSRQKNPDIQFTCQKRIGGEGVNASVFDATGEHIAVAYGHPQKTDGLSGKIEGIAIYKTAGTEKSLKTFWMTAPVLQDTTQSSGAEAEPLRAKARKAFRHCYASAEAK